MRGINRVTLIGNLGRDPEIQYLEGNIPVAKFPLATTETFKDRNGRLVNQTEWHAVTLWRGLAELSQKFLRKGSPVYVEGRLRTRHWEDRDGIRKSSTEIVVDNLIMLDKKSDGNFQQQPSFSQDTEQSDILPEMEMPPVKGDASDALSF